MFKDYSVYKGRLSEIPTGKSLLINTINQYSYCIAETDPAFKEALLQSDILLPDGVGITAAFQFLFGKKIKKIAGADLHQYMLEKLNKENGSCFYLGSTEKTLSKIRERISADYPNIKVNSYSPPFKKEFSEEDNRVMIETINVSQPDVLFVGLTAPKQEKWAMAHREKIQTGYICSIGAVFDFFAGTIERPGQFWIKIGLEWLIRLLKEPKRMWKRYLYFGPVFIYLVLKEKFQTSG